MKDEEEGAEHEQEQEQEEQEEHEEQEEQSMRRRRRRRRGALSLKRRLLTWAARAVSCGFQTRDQVSSCAYSVRSDDSGASEECALYKSRPMYTPTVELLLDGLQEPLRGSPHCGSSRSRTLNREVDAVNPQRNRCHRESTCLLQRFVREVD